MVQRWILYSAHFLIGVDGMGATIALPAVADDLGGSGRGLLTGYAAALGGLLLVAGRAGDLYGHRRMLRAGLAAMATGGVVAALAPSIAVLVGARAAQGAGAAAAMPAALALIATLPDRDRAVGRLAVAASTGVLAGLAFGGLVVTTLGWRAALLAGALPALVAAAMVPASDAARRGLPPDLLGALLLTAGAGLLAAGRQLPGAAAIVAFGLRERRAREPLVRFGVLRGPLGPAVLAVGLNAAAFTSLVYVGTLFLQRELGYSALAAGLALIPVEVASVATARFAARVGRRQCVLSLAVSAAGLLWLTRAEGYLQMLPALVVLGASLTVAFVWLTRTALARQRDRGLASGLFETSTHLGGNALAVPAYGAALGTGGYGAAFWLAAGVAVAGLVVVRVGYGSH